MQIIKKFQTRIIDEISTGLDKLATTYALWKAACQFPMINDIPDPFFMIGIPGSVHIMKLNARYIPKEINLILVLNGMDDWEEEKARTLLKPKGIIRINNNALVPHGKVLDLLFRNLQKPFGILDYDCFVFNTDYFSTITKLGPSVMLNSLFSKDSPVFGKTPHTFFCFFQTEIIQYIMKKYKVNTEIRSFSNRIPSKAQKQLLTVGINKNTYPETGKNYFDTLRLIVSLGFSEGFTCNCLDLNMLNQQSTLDAFHVGGVADPNSTYGWWAVRGSYFWWRALETCDDLDIVREYYNRYGNRKSSQIFDGFPEYRNQTKPTFFDTVEKIVGNAS